MAQPIKPRESYASDASHLQWLARVIMADKVRPEPWRRKVATQLNGVAVLLLEEEQRRLCEPTK